MKTGLSYYFIAAAVLCSAGTLHAAGTSPSLKLSGTYADVLKYDSEAGSYYTDSTGSASISGGVSMKGVDISSFDSSTSFSLEVAGTTVIDSALEDAKSYSLSKRTARWVDSDTGASMTISWTSNSLTISGTAKYDAFGVGALGSSDSSKIQNEEASVKINLGDFSMETTAYLNGSRTVKTVTKGSGDDQEEFELASVSVSGEADVTPPTATILQPAAGTVVQSGSDVTLSIKATDAKSGVSSVDYYMYTTSEDHTYTSGSARLNETNGLWTASFTPLPGTNYIIVTATDAAGNESANAVRALYCRLTSPITLEVVEGEGSLSGLTNGQSLEVGRTYTVTAKPAAGQVLAYWSDGADQGGSGSPFSFTMQEDMTLSLYFRTNPFPAISGTYAGLFYSHDDLEFNVTNAGAFTLTVTSNGAYSGKLNLLSGAVTLSGQLGLDQSSTEFATAWINLSRSKLPSLSGQIVFDLTGATGLSGELTQYGPGEDSDELSATFEGALVRSGAKTTPSKIYNFKGWSDGSEHEGYSFGSATVAGLGTVTLSLNLADKISAATAGSSICIDGSIPFCATLYSKKGMVIGWLNTVTNDDTLDLQAENIVWHKQDTSSSGTLYPDGFETTLSAIGSLYTAPKGGTNILGWTTGQVVLNGSVLESEITPSVTFDPKKNTFVFSSADNTNRVALKLATATGMLSGSFYPDGSKKSVSFKGIALPKLGGGYGFFTATNGAGNLRIEGASEATLGSR
jgi:hypothetical protein